MSDLTRAITKARRTINDAESPYRRALANAYQLAVERIETELRITARQLEGAEIPASWFDRRGRFTPTGELLFRQQRLRRLLPLAEAEFRRFSDTGLRLLREGHVAAVSGGAAEAWELMDAVGIDTGFGARINTQATEQLVASFREGLVRDVLDGYGRHTSEIIERLLIQGVTTGEGPRQVVKRIMGELNSPYMHARLESLVFSQMMDAFRDSLGEQFGAMEHVADGYRRVAAKSVRTCLACLALDGQITKERPVRFHIRCRCVFHLVPKGTVIPYETGPDWFARQSAETQRTMMPSGPAYQAYERGDVQLRDFVGHKRSKVWGTSITELSGREALRRAS